jgi:hypothetical protein
MTSTIIVLVFFLVGGLLGSIVLLAATSRLAKRNGQELKSMSWSLRHGYAAEFFKSKDHRGDTN